MSNSHKMASYSGGGMCSVKIRQSEKEIEKIKTELEQKKKAVMEKTPTAHVPEYESFSKNVDNVEEGLRSNTVGLVTLSQMKEKQRLAVEERERQIALRLAEDKKKTEKEKKRRAKEKKRNRKLADKNKISFGDDGDEENEETEVVVKKSRIGKDMTVDTSFLPSDGKNEKEQSEREEIRKIWIEQQARLKNQIMEFEYVYWDGSPHPRDLVVKKGDTIEIFLQRCRQQLRIDFIEMKSQAVDQMMFIKADTIIPHQYTFYDLIVTKAEGKSGTLFDFQKDEDNIKVENTAVMAKATVKVCTRNWYENNKHVYPANVWESYEPEKKYEKYKKSGKVEDGSKAGLEINTKGSRCPNCGYGRGKLGEISYGTCYLCCEYKDGAV